MKTYTIFEIATERIFDAHTDWQIAKAEFAVLELGSPGKYGLCDESGERFDSNEQIGGNAPTEEAMAEISAPSITGIMLLWAKKEWRP